MTVAVTIDAIPYLIQPANGPAPIAHTHVQKFHDRPKVESFVHKVLGQNQDQLQALRHVADVSDASQVALESALIASLLEKSLLVVRDASASGGGASRPPSAQAVPAAPKVTDHIDGSAILSAAMKTYLKDSERGRDAQTAPHQSGDDPVAANPQSASDADSSDEQTKKAKDNNYEVVIEIAGRHLSKKHSLILKTEQGDSYKKYPSNDHKSSHRNLCRFSNLESGACELSLAIPIKGFAQPMVLPLHEAIPTSARGVEKPIWNTVLVPVKPLQFLSEQQQKGNADLLQDGWLYVFWKGKLWRELKVSKRGVLQDVNLEFYRGLKTEERKAEGHWLDAVWVPYLLNDEQQSDVVFAASAVQWSWGTIEAFESNSGEFKDQTASLETIGAYQGGQSFDEAPAQSGSIENASSIDANANSTLDRQKRQKIAAAYLPKVGAKLKVYLKDDLGHILNNVDFELKAGDQIVQARTDSRGYLETTIPSDLTDSEIHFYNKSPDATVEKFVMKLAETEPVETVKGLQSRLNNLGFDAGVVDGISGRRTKSATRAFQTKHNLMVDGISGPQTQGKLVEEHQS